MIGDIVNNEVRERDVAAAILEAANGGATKTKIMYNAFIAFHPCP
ncbi:MAG TPA: hypothetical protein VE692_01635 [Nitrososphaera sp.]|nr:hypothetical protein [Nitrososphaera sp.]